MKNLAHFYRNRPVLVTGGAGFIGSHVVEQLVQQGAKVTIVDDLSTGKLENLSAIIQNIRFIQGTILDRDLCQHVLTQKTIVIHLAAIASVAASIEHPLVTHDVNITGTANLLETARHIKVERFLFASSSAVYGNSSTSCHEDMPCNPTSPYGFSKLMGENYLKHYTQLYGLPTLNLRFFNVIGSRQKADSPHAGVAAQWRKKMATQEPITLLGDGNQTRDFVTVSFVADTIVRLAALTKNMLQGTAVNIASGKSISLNELLTQLKQEFPAYDQPITYAPARAGDIMHSVADCTKLNSLLGLCPNNLPGSPTLDPKFT